MTLELAVCPTMGLQIDGTEYVLEFNLAATIQAEEKLGRSLKSPGDWFTASAKDIPALLEAGLSRHHPDVTPAEITAICDRMSPEMCGTFAEALGALAFPRFTARFKENLERMQKAGGPDL